MRFSEDETTRLHKKLALEMGPVVRAALEDERVVEICVNEDGIVRVERLGVGFEVTTERLSTERVIGLLKTIATLQDQSIGRTNPVLESWIPTLGARIEGILPPVSRHAVFSIRKHSRQVFSLQDYV
ncbi:MAG: type secretion system protein, partial [Myxococcaceae bacterium]|nr:type secretion system protein [Myxococcaceae bacterium]